MMKKKYILCFLIIACLFNYLAAQDKMRHEIKDDAIQLAARLLEKNQLIEEIPNSLIDSITNILTKIARSNFKQSTVIKDFDMQAYPKVDVYNIYFFADASVNWVQAFMSNKDNIPAPLDYLFYSYEGISLELIQASDLFCEFKLHSTIPMNMNNFGRKISNLPGVEMVILGGNDTKENYNNHTDIKLDRISNAWIVSYYYKPLNSNIGEYYWQFSLEDNGQIEFIGEYGETPPPSYKVSTTL